LLKELPTMLDTILVPLDGSEQAARAVPYATMLARSAGAKVVLMRALSRRAPGNASEEREEIRTELYLDAAVLRADGLSTESVVRRIWPIRATDIAGAISAAVDEQGAGLIVMSTHGRSGLGRWLYGSVTDGVLRQTTTPVLLVPPHADQPLPTDRPLRLLVPLDGSELAQEATLTAEVLAETVDAEIVLLRVVEPPAYPLYGDGYAYIPFDPDAQLAEAKQYIQEEANRLQAAGKRVTVRALVGQPSTMVAQVAHDEDVDIIMMATHGRGGLTRLVLGSVATATLQRAQVPVLLVRPSAVREGDDTSRLAPAAEDETVSDVPAAPAAPTIDVHLSMADLELLERGIKTLAYTPGYDYRQAPKVHVLLDRLRGAAQRLERAAHSDAPEPATTR
jgi:nucleotide-binding universal stress UspA family protein